MSVDYLVGAMRLAARITRERAEVTGHAWAYSQPLNSIIKEYEELKRPRRKCDWARLAVLLEMEERMLSRNSSRQTRVWLRGQVDLWKPAQQSTIWAYFEAFHKDSRASQHDDRRTDRSLDHSEPP